MNKTHEIDMTRGKLFPKLLAFLLPLMLSSLLQIAFNAADLIVVGRFGRPNSLAAVGSNGPMINLIVTLLMGLATGGGVLCARHYGARDAERLRATVSTALIVGGVGGVLIGAIGVFLAEPMLRLIGSPEDVAPLAAVYLRILFAGLPAAALYNFAGAALRAMGNTRQPLIFLAVAGVVNVLLNLFFVIVLGIDVAGVALATVLSQCLSCYLTVRCLLRAEELSLRELRFSLPVFRRIAAIGLPAGVQGALFSISNFLIQAAVNSFGAAVVAGNAACISLENFLYCPQDAAAQTATTSISQNVGAQEYKRSCRAMGSCLLLVTGISAVMSGLTLLFRRPLLGLYTTDEAALAAAFVRMGIVVLSFTFNGTMAVMNGTLRGLGRSLTPAIVTFLGVCALRIVWLYTAFAAHRTLPWLYVSYPITWVLTTGVLLICYFAVRKKPFHVLREGTTEERKTALTE